MPKRKIPTLDLHGRTKEEVFPLLDHFIMKNQEVEEVLLIVGKGRGIVRQKAIEWLKGAKYPYRYERIRGVENTGALIIDLS